MTDSVKHVGILGMKWGKRKANPKTDAIIQRANKVLNNPKSSKTAIDKALSDIGVDPKTGKQIKAAKADIETSKVYIKQYLKRAGGALVAGLVVAQAGKMLAESFINARNLERLESILKK